MWPLHWWLLWKPNIKFTQTYHFQGLKIIPSFQGMRDSPQCFQGLVLHSGTSRLPVTGIWHWKVLDFLHACSALHYFHSHLWSSWWHADDGYLILREGKGTVLRDQHAYAQLHWEWVPEAGFPPRSVWLQIELFLPITLCSVFELHSRFYGSFCYFSVTFLRFVSHSCSFTKGQLRLPVTCFL